MRISLPTSALDQKIMTIQLDNNLYSWKEDITKIFQLLKIKEYAVSKTILIGMGMLIYALHLIRNKILIITTINKLVI